MFNTIGEALIFKRINGPMVAYGMLNKDMKEDSICKDEGEGVECFSRIWDGRMGISCQVIYILG